LDSRGDAPRYDSCGKKIRAPLARFPPRCRRLPPRCRQKIMKILTHARTTAHYPEVSQGPGICTSYIIVFVVVDNGCECFGESRAAFNARFFGRLLSKQTFRRRSTLLFPSCGSTCPLCPPPRDHITCDRAKNSRPRFSGSRPSTNIPLVLGTCVNKSRDNSSHLAFFEVHALRKHYMITTMCGAKEWLRSLDIEEFVQ